MAKKGAVKEPEEELEELEELEESDAEEAPAKTKGKSTKAAASNGADEVTFGVQQLCDLIKEKTGREYKPKDVRTLLRKMAREDKPRIDREVIPGNKTRYSWPDGPKDPEVKAVLKAVSNDEIEAGKKEALDRLKEQGAAKKAEKASGGGKKGKGKKGK